MHWDFGLFWWKSQFYLGNILWATDINFTLCLHKKATSQQITLLHWPTNVPFPGYDVIRKQMVYGFSWISCSVRSCCILLQQRALVDLQKLTWLLCEKVWIMLTWRLMLSITFSLYFPKKYVPVIAKGYVTHHAVTFTLCSGLFFHEPGGRHELRHL